MKIDKKKVGTFIIGGLLMLAQSMLDDKKQKEAIKEAVKEYMEHENAKN